MNFNTKKLGSFGILIEPKKETQDIRTLNSSEIIQLVDCHFIAVLRGFQTFHNSDEFCNFCRKFGEISAWPFGQVLELVEQTDPQDHIFANSSVPMHWDGMYRTEVPQYQIFHCLRAPSRDQGGRTLFSNTIQALKDASAETRALWNRARGSYERKVDFYHSRVTSPIVSRHPFKDVSVIRYNEPAPECEANFINPSDIRFEGITADESAIVRQSLQAALYSPSNLYAHHWQIGDVVISDNFSLLHGREKFTSQAERHLQRIHVLSDPPFKNPNLELFR